MTSATNTYASPFLQLQASPDEVDVVVAFPSGMERSLVTATTNPITGGVELSVGGKNVSIDTNTLPVVLIGGDHPQNQWWGTNGTNGLAQMYKDNGITPYIAINTHSQTGEGVGDAYQMSWEQLRALDGTVEIVSHGARHYSDWEAPDAGIHVKYVGAAATATMYVTSTSVVSVTAGGVDDFTLAFTTYPTLSELSAAIDALPSWTSSYSKELAGTELSTNLLTIASTNAKSCKTATTWGARFSAAGGLRVFWDSLITAADSVKIYIHPASLNIIRNGVRISSFTLSAYTMSSLLTAVKAANAALVSLDYYGASITSLVNDIGGAQAYCTGEEDASNLGRNLNASVHFDVLRTPAILHAGGLTPSYLRQRNLKLAKDSAAANGIALNCFAQSGAKFFQRIMSSTSPTMYEHYRGNPRNGIPAPCGMPTHMAKYGFHTHVALHSNYDSVNYIDTLVDGIIDSPGHVFDLLIHGVTTDAVPNDGSVAGSSGYYIDNTSYGYDINEAAMVRLMSRLAAARDSGLIRIVKQRDLNRVASIALPPRNLFINSGLKARSVSLKVTDNSGQLVPGWKINGFTMQEVSAVDGGFEFTSNGSMATVLQQRVSLGAGKRYCAGARIETTSGQLGYVKIFVAPAYTDFLGAMVGADLTYISSAAFAQNNSDITFDFEVPGTSGAGRARIVSLNAQPFDLSANKNIKVLIEGSTGFDIDCSAGAAVASAVTAKEVASAINAAIAGNAQFLAKPELHTIASGENGRVLLESPRLYAATYSVDSIALAVGSTASATSAIFGGTAGYAWCEHAGKTSFADFPVDIRFVISAAAGVKIKILDPWLVETVNI